MRRRTPRTNVVVATSNGRRAREERLAAEEPLEIRIGATPFTTTMRTPGDDFDLVAGFLVGEGVVAGPDDIVSLRYCGDEGRGSERTFNVVEVVLGSGARPPDPSRARRVLTTSACGVCGTTSIDEVRRRSAYTLSPNRGTVGVDVLLALPDRLRQAQALFDATGGTHAAGLFDRRGTLLLLREDVGRHNAVDKVVGAALRGTGLPLSDCVLQVSGRASFELVQKAAMAGIPVLSAVSAPSSLAVSLAEDVGLTLAAFSRGSTVNLYSHPHRVMDPMTEQEPT